MEGFKNALIIFARKPELGKVKTRLAADIGNEKALEIYIKLMQHTKDICIDVPAEKYVFLTELNADGFWSLFNIKQQEGIDLGEKMNFAFHNLFKKNYEKCIVIGSDCPTLTSQIIKDAFEFLNKYDAVIGPAVDGGYYLLGMNKMIPSLFINKDWSTEKVLSQTIDDLETHSQSYKLLEFLSDVDEKKDVPSEWLSE